MGGGGLYRCPEVTIAQEQAQNSSEFAALVAKYAPTLAAVSAAVNQTYDANEDVVRGLWSARTAWWLSGGGGGGGRW